MLFDLPKALDIGGKSWEIRTDYRDILTIIQAIDDPDLSNNEKIFVCLTIMYVDFDDMPETLYEEAFKAAIRFIDRNNDDDNKLHGKKNMDWEQDAQLLFPAVNHVAGFEVRSVEYMHWWTFIGYFMEISDGVYSTVLSLRSKKNKGKKLEKWEQQWWKENLSICKLNTRYSEEEKSEQAALKALLGG